MPGTSTRTAGPTCWWAHPGGPEGLLNAGSAYLLTGRAAPSVVDLGVVGAAAVQLDGPLADSRLAPPWPRVET